MAESGDFEDGDLKLPEGEEMKKTLFGIIFSEASSTKKLVSFCLRTMVSKQRYLVVPRDIWLCREIFGCAVRVFGCAVGYLVVP